MKTFHAETIIQILTKIIVKNYAEDNYDDDDDNDDDNNDMDDDHADDDDDENTPGPFAPPGRSRPSLKMTALSYSCTTCHPIIIVIKMTLKMIK